MTDSDPTTYSPGHNATPGVPPGELLGRALESKPLTGDPHAWQPPSPEALQAQLHGYEVQQFVARGGMGAVYRGVQTSLGRQVAIKILPPELRDADPHYAARFKQEARAMAQLNHPAIVSVYDFGEMPDGTFYFIMEFIDGTDVGQMVAQQGRLASAHAMAITAHVCDALQYAHERGIVHRDIKPANIMVGFDGRVKVADFGLAKSIRQVDTGLTQSGFVMGTPHFVAPEAMIMGFSVDHRADIYAVGVMLYQMLTGKVPQGLFEMPSLQVPGLDPRYDAIVSSAMRENRDQRYQHIIDMRRALDAIVTQPVQKSEVARQTVPATVAAKPVHQQRPTGQPNRAPQRNAPPPRVKEKSRSGIWLLAAAVVLSLGGIAWMKMGNNGQPSTITPVAKSTVAAAGSSKSSQMGPLGDLVFPIAPFQNATIPEVIKYLQVKSRDLDPSKQGITILADEATRNTPASISMDFKDAKLADLIECFARLARLEVSYADNAVQLKTSSLVKPPFPIGKPTEKLQKVGDAILPIMPFNKATLEAACEYVRDKGRDVSGQHVNLLIDPALIQQKHEITLDVTQVSISTALAYIADLCEAEVAYIGESFYLQPASTKPVQVDPWAVQSFGEAGKIILPTMSFRNATIHQAVEFLVTKSRDLDPQKKGVDILLDEGAGRSARKITLDSQNISVANAVAQVAVAAGLELYRVGEAARLRAPAAAKTTPVPAQSPAGTISPSNITEEKPFTNSLGMKFVPVPGTKVLMCIHETRRSDYEAFAAENPNIGREWKDPEAILAPEMKGVKFSTAPDHPVVYVSSLDADEYCKWLSKKEGRAYRLPTWQEWSWAVGTGPLEPEGESVEQIKAKLEGVYPWGKDWPPHAGAGNIADETMKTVLPKIDTVAGYRDGFASTAPVMHFLPNNLGIYDMCGNVTEWLGDYTSKRDQPTVSKAVLEKPGRRGRLSCMRCV